MKKKLEISIVVVFIGVFALLLGGCGRSHQPLGALYYGYYNDNDTSHFVILAFDKQHPKKVAIRMNMSGLKLNGVTSIKYKANSVIIKTTQHPMVLSISPDTYTLTCASCDNVKLPKTYKVGKNKGKAYGEKVGASAFKTITYEVKENGNMVPSH